MRLIPPLAAAVSALTLAACEPADTQTPPAQTEPAENTTAPAADPDALTPEGWRTLRVGMTRAEVEAAMGPNASPYAPGEEAEICDQILPAQAPEGMVVMLGDGVLSRISVSEPSTLVTADGFGVGSSAAEIKAFYGDRAVVSRHAYNEPPAEDIFVWDGARPTSNEYIHDTTRRGIRYEIGADGNVLLVHVGGTDIQLVEGCS